MKLAFTHTFPAPPAEVGALMSNEEFLKDVADHAGAVGHSTRINGNSTELEMEIPAPENVQKAVGKTVKLALDMHFGAPDAAGVVPGHVEVKVPGMPVDAKVDARIVPTETGSTAHYDGELKVKIPLIGKKVEAQVEPFVVRAFKGIESRANAWLSR